MRPHLEADPEQVIIAARANGDSVAGRVIQSVEFDAQHCEALSKLAVEDATFIGCRFASSQVAASLTDRGALVVPRFDTPDRPYRATRHSLYTVDELLAPFTPEVAGSFADSIDAKIYEHFDSRRRTGRMTLRESLAQRIHDHAIDDALTELLFDEDWSGVDARAGGRPDDCVAKKVVGVMGGHSLKRGTALYLQVAEIGYRLAQAGYFVATGGGPGAMEAANLGAWMSTHDLEGLAEAASILAQAPDYSDANAESTHAYLSAGHDVLSRFADSPNGAANQRRSLAIPTWFYGHEPTNQFATEVAKYFSNSLREDGLLATAQHGIIFAPGKAGTTQEIFQDTCQNHYGTTRMRFRRDTAPEKTVSPMVFLGTQEHWRHDFPVLPLLEALGGHGGQRPKQYLGLTTVLEHPEEIVQWLLAHPPVVFSG